MADRYVLKRVLDTKAFEGLPFSSEEQALEKAAKLFDQHGPSLQLEIWLNDMPPALRGAIWMADWNRHRKSQSN
jgi:hypothetical protein